MNYIFEFTIVDYGVVGIFIGIFILVIIWFFLSRKNKKTRKLYKEIHIKNCNYKTRRDRENLHRIYLLNDSEQTRQWITPESTRKDLNLPKPNKDEIFNKQDYLNDQGTIRIYNLKLIIEWIFDQIKKLRGN